MILIVTLLIFTDDMARIFTVFLLASDLKTSTISNYVFVSFTIEKMHAKLNFVEFQLSTDGSMKNKHPLIY